MKKITAVLLIALSFGATAADEKAAQLEMDARCLYWGLTAGLSEKELDPLKVSLQEGLENHEMYYQFGFADGFLIGSTLGKNDPFRKKKAYKLYSQLCITAK